MMRRMGFSQALVWYLLGTGAVCAAGLTMGDRLKPVTEELALLGVWWLSACIIGLGFLAGLYDLARLWRERRAMNQAHEHQAYFVEVAAQDPGLARSLVGSRATRVRELRHETGASLQGIRQGLRAEALSRSASIGSFTRFLASVLLLLAVLGTFAGMKTALPPLIESLKVEENRPDTIDQDRIGLALEGVENAFGANYLALIGALGLVLLSFGAQSERRGVLAALEHFSDRFLYPQLPAGADTTAIERVVLELRSSIGEVAAAGASIGDLRASIDNLQTGLGQAIGGMHAAFTGQFQRDLIRYHADHAERASELTKGVSEIATALTTTSVAYQGLVEGLRERDYGLSRAAAATLEAARTASTIHEQLSSQLEVAAGHLRLAATELGTLSDKALTRLDTIATAHATTVQKSTSTLEAISENTRRSQVDLANVHSLSVRLAQGQATAAESTAQLQQSLTAIAKELTSTHEMLQRVAEATAQRTVEQSNRLDEHHRQANVELHTIKSLSQELVTRLTEVSETLKGVHVQATASNEATRASARGIEEVQASLKTVGTDVRSSHDESVQHVKAARSDITELRKDVLARLEEVSQNGASGDSQSKKGRRWFG